jgi:hypothetical protein
MIVVRQWMTNSFKPTNAFKKVALLFVLTTLASCNPTEITSSGQRTGTSYGGEMLNKAFIYRDSPYINRGPNFSADGGMAGSVDTSMPEFITDKSLLKGDCTLALFNGSTTLTDCLHTYASKSAGQQLLARNTDGTWVFPVNSSEFYQVNALYHVQHGVDTFFEKLKFTYDSLHFYDFSGTTKSTPYYLPQTGLFWFQAITPANDNYFRNSFLRTYALCNFEQNAQFQPAGPDICLGNWAAHPSFFMVQDPSIIYHELGHALIAVMMNFRNGTPGGLTPNFHALRSNLGGSKGYDEAGSIGEGVADYYSFVMNQRTHFGEWGLGKTRNSRPISEDDSMHIPGIDTTSEGRLSYPQYVLYDPNDPDVPFEDIHYSGQIISHYLVALTKSLQTECSIPASQQHDTSTSYVMMLLAESFSEMGDLKSVGVDTLWGTPNTFAHRFNNLDENASYIWSQVINPPTYRKFAQLMSKNIFKYISSGLCPGFTKDESEKLLDDYGLLLFKTYNNNNSSTKNANIQYNSTGTVTLVSPVAPTAVHENNRRKSVMVSKQLLSMALPDAEADVASYYIIDDAATVAGLIQDLLFKGFPMNPSPGISGVEYNNGNIRLSPGEIVAIIPNLYNSSNSTMAGVHLLATDWDHVHITDTTGLNGNFKPCVVDDVTTIAQGAEAAGTCTTTMTSYKRHVKTGGLFSTTEAAAPVCLVELEDGDATKWVSQNEFRKKQGLSLLDKDCLGYSGTAQTEDFTFNPHECLVRVMPGANQAFYSKIDAQKSYRETMRVGNPDHIFNPGNAIIFEINKWIPPGTKFRCRLRAKFNNCSDCFSSSTDATNDDYIDAEYNGAKPFKIINFEFDVND